MLPIIETLSTDHALLAILGIGASIIVGIVNFTAIFTNRQQTARRVLHLEERINGRMDELLAHAESMAHAAGVLQGIAEAERQASAHAAGVREGQSTVVNIVPERPA